MAVVKLRPKLVCWDLDGVLVDVEDLHCRAFNAGLQAVGHDPILAATYRDLHVYASTKKYALMGIPASAINRALAFKNVAFATLVDDSAWSRFPNVAEAVRAVHATKIGVGVRRRAPLAAVTSNGSGETVAALRNACPFKRVFSRWVAASAGLRKPDPKFYLAVCVIMDVPPSDAIAVEDSEDGVAAAIGAGMRVIQVSGPADVTVQRVKAEGLV